MIQKQIDYNNRKKKSIPKLEGSQNLEKDETVADKFFGFFGCGPKTKKENSNNNMDNFRQNKRRNSSDEDNI